MKAILETVRKYRFGDFIVDVEISSDPDVVDVWLYHKNFGVKIYMFGISSKKPLDELEILMISNLDIYKKIYKDKYIK